MRKLGQKELMMRMKEKITESRLLKHKNSVYPSASLLCYSPAVDCHNFIYVRLYGQCSQHVCWFSSYGGFQIIFIVFDMSYL